MNTRKPRPMPYWFANQVYRRVGQIRLAKMRGFDDPFPFYAKWDRLRLLPIRSQVRASSRRVRYPKVYAGRPPLPRARRGSLIRCQPVRRHMMGAWR